MSRLATLVVVFGNILLTCAFHNNVCKSLSDYYTNLDQNKNCYYNPDGELSTSDIIQRQGYAAETHIATTDDGYTLTIFRIPYSKFSSTKKTMKQPIFLQHGLACNSNFFINAGKNSLGFYLSDAGYDVWIGNFRGNMYSLEHKTLSNISDEFWDFSFHEHGLYDISAQLALIKKVTKQKIIYIGHSMGTTAAFIYGALQPQLASENIKYFVALAPIVFMKNIRTESVFEPLYEIFTDVRSPAVLNQIFKIICYLNPSQVEFCGIIQMFVEGFNYEQLIPEILPIAYRRDSASPKVLLHYYQMMKSGKFEQFNYGPKKNKLKYGLPHPPEYNLSNIDFPVQLILALNDQLSTLENVKRLYRVLPKKAKQNTTIYIIKDKKINHSLMIYGKDAKRLVFDVILKFLSDITLASC